MSAYDGGIVFVREKSEKEFLIFLKMFLNKRIRIGLKKKYILSLYKILNYKEVV